MLWCQGNLREALQEKGLSQKTLVSSSEVDGCGKRVGNGGLGQGLPALAISVYERAGWPQKQLPEQLPASADAHLTPGTLTKT